MCGWMTAQSRRAAVREIAINHGTFQRQNAAAMSSYFRLSENVVLSGGLSYGVEAKQFGGRAGVLFAWQGNRSRAVE